MPQNLFHHGLLFVLVVLIGKSQVPQHTFSRLKILRLAINLTTLIGLLEGT
jgi:hypothetical protein